MRTQATTLMKEDVLALGRQVHRAVIELVQLLASSDGSLAFIEEQEEEINDACYRIEEKCLDYLQERQDLEAREIRMLVGSIMMATKFERLADHVQRVARLVTWASTESQRVPGELVEMVGVVKNMVEEVLLSYLGDAVERIPQIVQQDSRVNYLHDVLSKRLLAELSALEPHEVPARAQLLFCTRYVERMGDCCVSIGKRIHFAVTGQRLKRDG
jgi:phosphate transport system protein